MIHIFPMKLAGKRQLPNVPFYKTNDRLVCNQTHSELIQGPKNALFCLDSNALASKN